MRWNTGPTALVLAALGLVVLSACSGGDASTLGPVPTAPSTTVAVTVAPTTLPPATSSTTVARPESTVPPTTTPPTTTTVAPAVLVNGVPQVTATPARAAVGTLVRIEGNGFTDDMWRARSTTLWIAGNSGCDLYAQAEHTVTVSPAGRLTGEFVVPALGVCRMSDIGERPVTSGSYRIAFTCTACAIGAVDVTTTAGPCVSVGFTPNSDDVASSIVATGVGCVEAEALVRKVGAQVGAIGGPTRVESDGWVCTKVSQNTPVFGLDSSDFECVSGPKKVTFRRT